MKSFYCFLDCFKKTTVSQITSDIKLKVYQSNAKFSNDNEIIFLKFKVALCVF